MTTAALSVALTILAGLAMLQVLLICGQPVGAYAWGGQHRVAPPRLRWACGGAIVLHVAFSLLLMSRAGVLPGGATGAITLATWALFAYCAISIVLNAISRSRPERLVQTPVSAVLTLSVLLVALTPAV